MKIISYLNQPKISKTVHLDEAISPAADCGFCHNGCCGSNSRKMTDDLHEVLADVSYTEAEFSKPKL